ncbi:MAG: flagellin [Ruminococcus sp.]|nr:flagellin [Ruminococcus sp.]
MVVRTNMGAINANNALTKNNSTVNKNIEKLSSGFRINRAADDASGLAISEKMKRQIKALDTATANAEDGISLIQTAEGYMGEIHDMLNRMVELAEKSANGTYQMGKATGAKAYNPNSTVSAGTDRAALQAEMDQLCAEIDRIAATANFNNNKIMDGSLSKVGGTITVNGSKVSTNVLTLQIGETSGAVDKLQVQIKSFKTADLFSSISASGKTNFVTTNSSAAGKQLDMKAQFGTSAMTLNISDQNFASRVAEDLKKVIDDVSTTRASLGAMQNRLDYTINNLTTASENISAANSRIRDTNMAKEMMKYTQGNVLTQAAQAMLAQANQAPQSVLQLLQ